MLRPITYMKKHWVILTMIGTFTLASILCVYFLAILRVVEVGNRMSIKPVSVFRYWNFLSSANFCVSTEFHKRGVIDVDNEVKELLLSCGDVVREESVCGDIYYAEYTLRRYGGVIIQRTVVQNFDDPMHSIGACILTSVSFF